MSTEVALVLAALQQAVTVLQATVAHLAELLAVEPAPEPTAVHVLPPVATSTTITVSWEVAGPEPQQWLVGRDGVDTLGSGAYARELAAGARDFRFSSLVPDTLYTLTVTPLGGTPVSVAVRTEPSVVVIPPGFGLHGPRAVSQGWVAHQVAGDDFDGQGVSDQWGIYVSAGHGGKGLRRASQFSIVDDPTAAGGRALRVVGTPDGTTGGMANRYNQRFGRWSGRMRFPKGDQRYHPVLLTWPQNENWPQGGEIDFAEGKCGSNTMEFFLHYSRNNYQTHGSLTIDTTQWHWYEMEWTRTYVRGWCDGVQYFEDTNQSHFNNGDFGRHHGTIQLDWFPGDARQTGGGEMYVDLYRVYSHDDSQ